MIGELSGSRSSNASVSEKRTSKDRTSNIKYVAVARSSDQTTVCSYVVQKGDYNSTQYPNVVQEVLSAPDFQFKVTPGSQYRLLGETNALNFTADAKQRVFIVIATKDYPERLAFPLINEIMEKFKAADVGDRSLSCNANDKELTKKLEPVFSKLVEEYDDPSKKDRLAAVAAKVEDVKLTMHSNIDGMLKNVASTEEVEKQTQKLQEQAKVFDSQARVLRRQEQWKNIKLMLIIGGIFIVLAIILIASLVGSQNKDNGKN